MNRTTRVLFVCMGIGVIAAVIAVSLRYTARAPHVEVTPVVADADVPAEEPISEIMESISIRRGDTLADLLGRAGLDRAAQMEMIASLKGLFDVKKLRAGSELILTRSSVGTLESIEYVIDADSRLQLSNLGGVFEAAVVEVPSMLNLVSVCGTLQGSLFASIQRTGERAELAVRMAEIFAWDLDFYTDPREGDEFCLLVERKDYLADQPSSYGRILAAKYDNAGTVYEAYLFPDETGKPAYYARDGRSLQSAFLRSPMQFAARVSSRFSHRRFHPVLKIYRPHLGTDYAAPTGTPVQAVAAGRVIFSGYSGGAGNLIKIQHSNGYESQYMHLSRRLVRAGQRVSQGQRIGLVGATGLATGPHLDFRLRKNGRFVDFERLKPPRASEIAPVHRAAFTADRDRYAGLMQSGFESGTVVLASGTSLEPVAAVD